MGETLKMGHANIANIITAMLHFCFNYKSRTSASIDKAKETVNLDLYFKLILCFG